MFLLQTIISKFNMIGKKIKFQKKPEQVFKQVRVNSCKYKRIKGKYNYKIK